MNVCMLAYAHYMNDARIKSYVRTLEGQGHQVDVIALKADGEADVESRLGGTIFRVMSKYQGESILMYMWSYVKFFFVSCFFLAKRSFRHRYDVVHVHNMPNALVFAAAVPRLLGARLLLDVHDLMPANYMAKFNAGEKSLPVTILNFEQRLSAMFADHVFCADDNQAGYLADRCKIPSHKITVLMNLPNVELFRSVAVEKKDDHVFRIVYHGTIAHRLGIDLIIRAMAAVVNRIPAELWIYGAGDYLPDALVLSSQLGVTKHIHFSKVFFPVEQIPKMVGGMDVGIIGNRRNLACDRYMLPVKLLEYVYLQVPVIAPRLAVIQRYFDDTMLRYYDPESTDQMAEAIVELYEHKDMRECLVRSAGSFYETHNSKAQADLYVSMMTPPTIRRHVKPSGNELGCTGVVRK